MNDFIVFLVIVWWIIASAVRAFKNASKGSTPGTTITPSKPVPFGRQRVTTPPAPKQATGFAGRNVRSRNPEQSRAIEGASRRLAEGEEYGPIVAEREADRAAELRFADETRQLIAAEPIEATSLYVAVSNPDNDKSRLDAALAKMLQRDSVLTGVILSEILGPPRSKRHTIGRY